MYETCLVVEYDGIYLQSQYYGGKGSRVAPSLRPVWSTQQIPELHGETLSQKTNKNKTELLSIFIYQGNTSQKNKTTEVAGYGSD